jgi:hypothetical protein
MGMGAMPFFDVLGIVLWIPWRDLFMCPLAVAGLGFRYFRINFLFMFEHPFKNPKINQHTHSYGIIFGVWVHFVYPIT